MKKFIIYVSIITVLAACNRALGPSASPIVNTEITNASGQVILAGHCSAAMIQQGVYSSWFLASQKSYEPGALIVAEIKPLLAHKRIEIFLGSWCGDSKREVPKMLKLLQEASFDTARVALIFVDNAPASYKQSPQHEEKGKNIKRVPTIIVYNRHRKEMGRIIESPVVSLEKDLLAILQGKPNVR